MRRKSSRNANNPSPEKTKLDLQRKSQRQSSRRRKRSSSRSNEDSDEQSNTKDYKRIERQDDAQLKNLKSDSDAKNDGTSEPLMSDSKNLGEINVSNENIDKSSNAEDIKDLQESRGQVEDMEEEKRKGKSKGKNKSNFEQSWNNVEPETENENVQGTPQSPSNDNADNENVIQNVNESTKFTNSEDQQGFQVEDSEVVGNEDQQQASSETDFVSEYSQINESSEKVKATQIDQMEQHAAEELDKDDKPSLYPENTDVLVTSENADNENKSSNEDGDKREQNNSVPKKKIALRRSSQKNKDIERVADSSEQKSTSDSSEQIGKKEDSKSSKRITLKRYTTENSSASDVRPDSKVRTARSLSEDAAQKRRLSSEEEEKDQNREEKINVFRRIKLIRNLPLGVGEGVTGVGEGVTVGSEGSTSKRQKWGRSDWLNKLTASFYKIDVESIRIVCPTLEFLSENEVNLESVPKERRKSDIDHTRKLSIDNKSEESDRPEYEKQTSEDSSGELKTDLNPNIIAMNRRISIVDDTASKLRPPPSPAKNALSDVLFITNLVRPFTVKQLKELLERTGKIREQGFWTDRIKSKCYVQYESVEEAEATRNALHGVHWPIGNGKKLNIDYATLEDMQKAKDPVPTPIQPEKLFEKENRQEPEKEETKFKDRDKEERRKRDLQPIREWDLGKEESRRRYSKSRSKSRERSRKHSRRSYTPEEYLNSKKHRKTEESVPQKLMDDLFLKTKATPSIYWQPLSPEEIATKQQQRLVRMEEHKRRIEETRGRPRDGRRIPFRRR